MIVCTYLHNPTIKNHYGHNVALNGESIYCESHISFAIASFHRPTGIIPLNKVQIKLTHSILLLSVSSFYFLTLGAYPPPPSPVPPPSSCHFMFLYKTIFSIEQLFLSEFIFPILFLSFSLFLFFFLCSSVVPVVTGSGPAVCDCFELMQHWLGIM